ncbi:hypothetical protein SAMN05421505_1043 [Sinosporangium album]|uniref:Uncharacterized protein n=1 Tax=Sinosporangium album TaxID=504805 RepID=A0A1G7TX55_9ACTN|nr:hypothetical protein SAMN05421505_1043 [Sinosporangium album]
MEAGGDPEEIAGVVREVVGCLADRWPEVVDSCPVPAFVRGHVGERLRGLPLVKGA